MAEPWPQTDKPLGLSGGADAWDDGLAGALLSADYFGVSAPSGNLNATESGSDTFVADGSAPSSGVSGTLNATESGSDTFASDGDVIVKGSLTATESGADTFASTGKVIVQGSLTAQESGSDTFASTGKVIVQGACSASESGLDTLASLGQVIIQGALSATEVGSDTFYAESTPTAPETPVVSGGGFRYAHPDEFVDRRKEWEALVQKFVAEKPKKQPKQAIEDVLPVLDEPLQSLASLLSVAEALDMPEYSDIQALIKTGNVPQIAETAFLIEMAIEQEKEAILALVMFME